MKKEETPKSHELAQKFLDGDQDISIRDIDREVELEWFTNNLDKYSKGNLLLLYPVAFILFIVYLFKFRPF